MNLVNRIFGRKNPTRLWVADPAVPLQVDLDTGRFCNVALGTPLAQLAHLGPSSAMQELDKTVCLVYREQGFQLFLDAAYNLEMVDINLLAEEDMAAFTGGWLLQNKPVTIKSTLTPLEVESLLGQADQREQGAHPALFYHRPHCSMWFEWGEGRQLENVALVPRKLSY